MAKQALLQRELKRDKLVAKFAKKHAELKAIANDLSAPTTSAIWPVKSCKSCRVTRTDASAQPLYSITIARVVRSVNSAGSRQIRGSWLLLVISLVLPRQAGKQ